MLDPVDAAFGFSTGIPLTGILLGLVVGNDPVLGLTWLPLGLPRGARRWSLLVVGRPVPPLTGDLYLGAATVRSTPGIRPRPIAACRCAAWPELAGARVRMTSSTGVDLSFTAAGIFGGAVIFGRHAWDNAPGTALVRAAGGVATDLPDTVDCQRPLHAGRRCARLHSELLDVITGPRTAVEKVMPVAVGSFLPRRRRRSRRQGASTGRPHDAGGPSNWPNATTAKAPTN